MDSLCARVCPWLWAPRFWTMPITGLLPASEYVVGIRGVNAVGEGAESLGAPWAVCVHESGSGLFSISARRKQHNALISVEKSWMFMIFFYFLVTARKSGIHLLQFCASIVFSPRWSFCLMRLPRTGKMRTACLPSQPRHLHCCEPTSGGRTKERRFAIHSISRTGVRFAQLFGDAALHCCFSESEKKVCSRFGTWQQSSFFSYSTQSLPFGEYFEL